MKNSFFRESLCLNSYLHRFEIKEEHPDWVLEVCEICKMKKVFRVIDGNLNNHAYMDYHIRLILPQFHPFYYHERGYDPLTNLIQSPYV